MSILEIADDPPSVADIAEHKCGCGIWYTGDFDKCTQCRGFPVVIHGKRGNIYDSTSAVNIKAEPPIIKKEEDIMPGLKEKTCIDCKRPFQPTSGSQLRCLPCIDIFKSKKPDPMTTNKKSKKLLPVSVHPDCQDTEILKLLVLAGVVTEAKIACARNLLAELRGRQ